jgi:hypothetical protein
MPAPGAGCDSKPPGGAPRDRRLRGSTPPRDGGLLARTGRRASRRPELPTAGTGIIPLLTLVLLTSLGLWACSTSGQTGRPFDPAGRRKLALGWTTRGEVRRLFGEPISATPGPEGTESWVYEHTQISALTLPLYGIVRARQTPHRILTIRFQYGVVAGCTFFEERYASRGTEIRTGHGATESCPR